MGIQEKLLDYEILVGALTRYYEEHDRGSWKMLQEKSGVDPSTLSRIASGEREPLFETWARLYLGAPDVIPPPTFHGDVQARLIENMISTNDDKEKRMVIRFSEPPSDDSDLGQWVKHFKQSRRLNQKRSALEAADRICQILEGMGQKGETLQ